MRGSPGFGTVQSHFLAFVLSACIICSSDRSCGLATHACLHMRTQRFALATLSLRSASLSLGHKDFRARRQQIRNTWGSYVKRYMAPHGMELKFVVSIPVSSFNCLATLVQVQLHAELQAAVCMLPVASIMQICLPLKGRRQQPARGSGGKEDNSRGTLACFACLHGLTHSIYD